MNVFQLSYETRLQSWYELRAKICPTDIQSKCQAIDQWWQQAPILAHHLHPADLQTWPSPWELIEENNYCLLARGLGIYYTLWLSGISDLDFLLGKDYNGEDVALITVDRAKYTLNGYPDMVISTTLTDYKITSKLDLTELTNKIG